MSWLWSTSYWALQAQATAIRSASSLAFYLHNNAAPAVDPPDASFTIDATLERGGEGGGKGAQSTAGPGAIGVQVYLPLTHPRSKYKANHEDRHETRNKRIPLSDGTGSAGTGAGVPSDSDFDADAGAIPSRPPYPVLINYHGGGFVLGTSTDDTRWCRHATSRGFIVFSIEYRLAPAHPFPTAVHDCADAILRLTSPAMADEWGSRRGAAHLSGFSAGGNLALAAWTLLQRPGTWGYDIGIDLGAVPEITGMVLFYPLVDFSIPRDAKLARAKRPDLALPAGLTRLFDCSYLPPSVVSGLVPSLSSDAATAKSAEDRATTAADRPTEQAEPIARVIPRTDLRVSPGLMPPALLAALPPLHLVLCEYDSLLREAEDFAEVVRAARAARPARQDPPAGAGGKDGADTHVTLRIVAEAKHGWDKTPRAPSAETLGVYDEAVVRLVAFEGVRMGSGAGSGGGVGRQE
jgi:acetyl esterase/lipase